MSTPAIDVTPVFRPASPGELADSSFEVWRRGLVPLTAISALSNLPLFAAVAGVLLYVREYGWSWGSPLYFVNLGLLSAAVAAAAWFRAVGTAASAHAALAAISGRRPSATSALATAFSVGAATGLASALRLSVILLGLLFCGIPGAVALFAFALTPHAVILERRPVLDAFVRSTRIAAKALGGIFTALCLGIAGYAVVFVQIIVFTRLAELLAGFVLPLSGGTLLGRPEAPWLALALAKVIVDPLVGSATAVAWVDGRIRADGLDLELRTQQLAGEALTIDPSAEDAA